MKIWTMGAFVCGGVWLGACSSEGTLDRPETSPQANAGSGSLPPSGGAGGTGSAGSAGAAGQTSFPPSDANLGDVLEMVPGTGAVPYAIGENPYGISGGAFLARSALGNTIEVASTPGEICISGNLEEVPGNNYGQYWGVELGFNLNQGAVAGDPAAEPADAGSDSGADAAAASDGGLEEEVARPWLPGDVIGFSFVIEGPTINVIRFKALADGLDPTLESSVYCRQLTPPSGQPQEVLFSEMYQYCWNPTGAPLPILNGLDNIAWQLPADVLVGARPFEWCLKDLRPILR